MRRGFVRAIWGDTQRQIEKIRKEVTLAREHDIPLSPVKALCWGRENYRHFRDTGFDPVLVSYDPYAQPPSTIFKDCQRKFTTGEACGSFWRHKLLALDLAFDHFDEFVFLDWDILPYFPLPTDFWERFQERDPIQATLAVYHVRQIPWKLIDMRKIVSGAVIYLRDRAIAKELLAISLANPTWREELCVMYYIDVVLGHFPRTDDQMHNARVYNDRHQPWCVSFKNSMDRHFGIDGSEAIFRY